jgi:hypothetical protein
MNQKKIQTKKKNVSVIKDKESLQKCSRIKEDRTVVEYVLS